MKIRKVNKSIILIKSVVYRIWIILSQMVFTFLFLGDWAQAASISIGWNLVNMVEYGVFEWLFARKWDVTVQTKGFVLWFTGLPCSGKTTLADEIAKVLIEKGVNVERLDGDIVRRQKLSNDLGFSKADRDKNINRVTFVSKLLSRNGTAVLASFVSPYRRTRRRIRKNVTNFVEVYVVASPQTCAKRDVKGMWARAKAGKIKGFTGYDDPYEFPENPEIIINTEKETVQQSTDKILKYLKEKHLI